ncbi:MAG: Imidazolonepropionase [Calditrichaeota bacterium]|nr:Imidazolonepropionase [Calditrichota bacterium]
MPDPKPPARTLLANAGWIVTPDPPGPDQALYTLREIVADAVLIEDERIAWVGRERAFSGEYGERIDLGGRGVTPGLIDFHAHPVFAATREAEFDLRTKGASYAEIAAGGGGILNSVKRVADTSLDGIVEFSRPNLDRALAAGTTTLEAKSGYGLDTANELKLLRAIRRLDETHPLDLVPTFLGAHEFPAKYRDNHDGYIELLIEEMIPAVVEQELAGACDIFCETGVYSVDEARRVLTAAKDAGMEVKVHADQLSPLGGAKLAVELDALSADHIEFIDRETVDLLAGGRTVAGLLPVAAHFLRMTEDPPVRDLIEAGAACALATDFNPGSAMSESMPIALHLAAIRFRVSAEEALWMATAGSARALRLDDRGAIAPGLLADLVVWDAATPEILPYHFAVNLAQLVIKRGRIAARGGRPMG